MIKTNTNLKPGHYEIHGETIAKFELFDAGFNPYSRYLDIDKIDLIVRFIDNNNVQYREIQVKYGRTYDKLTKNQKKFFNSTSWKIVDEHEFSEDKYNHLFIIYVLVHETGYEGDIFIFPIEKYNEILNLIISTNTKKGRKRKLYIARGNDENWYIWKKTNFDKTNRITNEYAIDITTYRRNFEILLKA